MSSQEIKMYYTAMALVLVWVYTNRSMETDLRICGSTISGITDHWGKGEHK